ncbi:hypothetical protein VB774_11580, partial [Pseudanabaena galeata UHCC 0370]|nr:hypothetical protein [Pseudanabaena galeata UHCC 0370]
MLPSELEALIEQAAREEWEELDLAGEGIEVLPATIAKCKSLQRLILGKITERKYYNIYDGWTTEYKNFGNLLKTLPPEIAELTNLQHLDLSNNSLSEIPDSITRLTNLHSLN